MTIEKLIAEYIESKKESWSESTLKSERSRLSGVSLDLLRNPEKLFKFLKDEQGKKPYAVKTAFIRAGEVVEFAMDKGYFPRATNVVKRFMQDKAQLFKHAYEKKSLDITFEEALDRISQIMDKESREKAEQLLLAGMRWAESQTLKDGRVNAKGGGTRSVTLAQGMDEEAYGKHYTTFLYHMKKVGLTPHMLRKLCATKAVELGADLADLMKLFGWSNSQTPMIYVQAQKEKELAGKMKELRPGRSPSAKQVSKTVRKPGPKAPAAKR